jgi:DMSO/TMAO reductase YedYZ molybdopterin-dependent catalytic subunit
MNADLWQEQSLNMRMERRVFLRGAAAATLLAGPLVFGAYSMRARPEGNAPGLIARQRNPDNLEFPFASLDRFITRNELFYVRNHFAQPTLDARTWRLRVEGAVRQPLQLSLQDLRGLPSRTVTATLECAGNGMQNHRSATLKAGFKSHPSAWRDGQIRFFAYD